MPPREFQGKDIQIPGQDFPNMRMANTIQPNRNIPERDEQVKRSMRKPEPPNFGFHEDLPNRNMMPRPQNQYEVPNFAIREPEGQFNNRMNINNNAQNFGRGTEGIKRPQLQYEVPNFGRESDIRINNNNNVPHFGRATEGIKRPQQLDVPNFGRGREEFSQRVDISRMNNNQEPLPNFGRQENVKRSGMPMKQQIPTQEDQNNPFLFNNKNNNNNVNNLTGSYVRPGGNKNNDDYLRKTYNYYGEYRDKSNVKFFSFILEI